MKKYEKRKLEELNLIDNFLFGAVMNNPEYGPLVSRRILERIIGRKLNNFTLQSEVTILGDNPSLRGIRIDAVIDEEGSGTIPDTLYDMEPNGYSISSDVFPKRARYHHSKIDGRLLESGRGFQALKDVYVIFILSNDPFGEGRIKYTFKSKCLENPELMYDDGKTTICLYTRGKSDGSSYEDKLSKLLNYIENSTADNTLGDIEIMEIHKMVTAQKHDRETGVSYMTFEELKYFEREEGRQQGFQEGFEEGHQEGFEEGHQEGFEEGRQEIWEKAGKIIQEKDTLLTEKDKRIAELEAQLKANQITLK